MCGICLADELQPVNPIPPVYRNFGGHCLMSGWYVTGLRIHRSRVLIPDKNVTQARRTVSIA
ncbi:hypothetical protein TNCV_1952231 [Trichonephila clavipes]|nr:hypothetical protein TNCV_1952231 [Trichonephila clavipes]